MFDPKKYDVFFKIKPLLNKRMICFHQLFLCSTMVVPCSTKPSGFFHSLNIMLLQTMHPNYKEGRESILTTNTAKTSGLSDHSEYPTGSRTRETDALQTPWPMTVPITYTSRTQKNPPRSTGWHCDSAQGAHTAESLSQSNSPASFIFRLSSVVGG